MDFTFFEFKLIDGFFPLDLIGKSGVYTITHVRKGMRPQLIYIGEGQILKRLISHYEKKESFFYSKNRFKDVSNWIITYIIENDKDTRCFIETALIQFANYLGEKEPYNEKISVKKLQNRSKGRNASLKRFVKNSYCNKNVLAKSNIVPQYYHFYFGKKMPFLGNEIKSVLCVSIQSGTIFSNPKTWKWSFEEE